MNEEKECGKISDNPIQLDNLHTDYGKKRDIKYFTIVDYIIANFNTNLRFLSLLSFGLAALFIIIGFVVMYYYSEDSFGMGHIVGGDAYNFIIIALRGLGFIITGLIFTVVGSILLIYDLLLKKFNG